jgi:hypothetical protein
VLQNKKYIKFANDNTVEVLSLGRLDEGIKKEDPKAAMYTKKNANGEKVKFMAKWPNLTFDMISKLRSSKAGTYNDTGKIPYTCLVNPHNLERMHIFKGVNAKGIMEEVKNATKLLKDEHGKGIKRKTINKINSAIDASVASASKGDWDSGYKLIDKVAAKPQNLPEALQAKITAAKDAITASARTRLDEIKNMEPKDAKKALGRFMGKAKKTGLVEEARETLIGLKDA